MTKKILFVSVCTSLLFAQSFEDYNKAQTQAFEAEKKQFAKHQKSQDAEFENYKKAQDLIFKEYRKEVGAIWKTPKMSTKTSWVAYSKDKKTRSDVDFKNKTITVETIASSKEEGEKKLKEMLKKVVTIDNKTFTKTDPLEVKLSKVKKPFDVVEGTLDDEPIISNMIFSQKPTQTKVTNYVDKMVQENKIVKKSKVYTLQIHMPKNALVRKSQQYYEAVKKQALKQKLPISLVFAIIHSESSFNPRARSYVPAYGLMQIVPRTAGIDAYNYLYKRKKLVSGNYLYNSQNNIVLGSAYLHILYYKYLSTIQDPQSRLYCTIAAYNTGAGNVARAFVRTNSVYAASKIINTMTPDEVYNKLLRDLKYSEAKHYLKKVYTRVQLYNKVYGS